MPNFYYDEMNKCYSLEWQDMRISCENKPDVELKKYGKKLIEKYKQSLNSIANYICMEKEFIEIYGNCSVGQTLKMLENNMSIPWIFLKSNNVAIMAYCDENYVMEFVVKGCFAEFTEFQISS